VASAVPPTLVVMTPTDSVVALVRIMKSMREMVVNLLLEIKMLKLQVDGSGR